MCPKGLEACLTWPLSLEAKLMVRPVSAKRVLLSGIPQPSAREAGTRAPCALCFSLVACDKLEELPKKEMDLLMSSVFKLDAGRLCIRTRCACFGSVIATFEYALLLRTGN